MEPHQSAATAETPQEVVARIEQKALRLSALLREIDNHPMQLDEPVRSQLDDILELLAVRITATRALLHRPSGVNGETVSAA